MPGTSPKPLTAEEKLERTRLDDALFNILEDHLNGVARGILRAKLEDLCNHEKQGGKDALTLYDEARISKANLEKLKQTLSISEKFEEPDTLFEWIKLLSQKNYAHRHLEDFYHLLQEVKPRKSWAIPLFITTLFSAISAIYLSSKPENMQALERLIARITPIITHFLSTTFSVLKNIPLVLLIYSILCIPSQAFHSYFHDTFRSYPKRFQKWLTGTLPAALSLVSYALCYAAGGIFTPLALGFFITSSFITVLSSLFNFYHLKPIGDEPLKTAPLEEKLDHIRQKERQARTVKTIRVNLVASVFVSISIILWGLLPPSFTIMIGCIVFINLVGFTKNATLNYIHTQSAEILQKELHETAINSETITPKPDKQLSETNSNQEILLALSQHNQELKHLITTEAQALKDTLKPEKPRGWFGWSLPFFASNTDESAQNTASLAHTGEPTSTL